MYLVSSFNIMSFSRIQSALNVECLKYSVLYIKRTEYYSPTKKECEKVPSILLQTTAFSSTKQHHVPIIQYWRVSPTILISDLRGQ